MDDRKGKRKEHEINESPRGSTRRTGAMATGTYGSEDGSSSTAAYGAPRIQAFTGQNAPRSSESTSWSWSTGTHSDGDEGSSTNSPRFAPVANQPHGLQMGQQHAAAPGGIAPRHGVHSPGLWGQAQGSGSTPPQIRACPACHNPVFSNTTCGHCGCEAPEVLDGPGPRPPPLPPQRQQRPHDPHQYMATVADRPIGQQRGGAIQDLRPGVQAGPPQAHPAPRDDAPLPTWGWAKLMEALPTISPRPQQQPQPPPIGAGAQHQLQHMAEQAAARLPVGERGGAAGAGGRSAAQLGLPVLQRPPQKHPVPPADKPVGFHGDPVVLGPGPGPGPDDGCCPACGFYPAWTLLQPWRHNCVCFTCRYVDGIVCPVCSFQ